MTFYRLWSGKPLENDKDVRKYIAADIDFFINVSEDIDIETGNLVNLRDEVLQKSSNEELSPRAQKITAAVLIGDAEWNESLEEWLTFPLSKIIHFTDSKVHHNWTKTARDYGQPNGLDLPVYSTPSTLEIDLENSSYMNQNILAGLLMDLEWYSYIAEEMDITLPSGLVEKTRKETLDYFLQDGEFSEDTGALQSSLAIRAADWIDEVKEEWKFRSFLLDYFSNKFRRVGEEELQQTEAASQKPIKSSVKPANDS